MEIKEIYNDFCNSIAEIIVLQLNTRSVMEQQIKALHKYKERFHNSEELNMPLRNDNMFFIDFRTGEHILFAQRMLPPDEYLEFINLKSNRDYQFYLASAYEKFEDAIELIYACLGKNDVNFGPLSEFGQEHYDNVKNLNFNFYVERAKNKKGGAIKIFKILIEKFNCNVKTMHSNVKVEMILIEKLRHIIIHNSGYITDKEGFINTVAMDAGILNNGNVDTKTHKYIESFFGKDKYEKLVFLLDRVPNMPKEINLPIYINIFENLINIIMFSVYIICEKSEEYISGCNEYQ